ncbi:DUF6056 family protein [Hymenobacter terrenus]|uniref:DUF6056 family protein n=1 Tax=Hymenobacter terrenus TaxID=1629124 RepID=UPI0006199655|nr:DUF6056 family protein [Hymenobacter terrenus]
MRNQKRLAVLLVFLTVLPFVVLSFYSHPGADDYSDAVQRRDLGFWITQRDLYLHLTGRLFTSVILTEVSPLARGLLDIYWLVPLLTLGLLLVSLYTLLGALLGAVWSSATRGLTATVLLALWLLQNPSVSESVYWFNGLAVYTLPTVVLVFWLATLVSYWQAEAGYRSRWLFLNLLLGTCLLWSNEIIALPLLAAVAALGLWEWWRRGPRRVALTGMGLWFSVALAVSLFAPGNMARAAIIDVPVSLSWMVAGSIASSGYLLLNWVSSGVLLFSTLLALPALVRVVAVLPPALRRLANQQPAHLLLAGSFLLALLPLAALPSYWATGGLMPPRARASMYLLFLLGWFATVLTGLLVARKATWLQRLSVHPEWSRPITILLWAGLFLNLATDHNLRVAHRDIGRASNNAVLAYHDWVSGSAARYDATLRARYRLLRTIPAQRLQIAALSKAARPQTLLYYDITTDSTHAINRDYALYFHQKAIWAGPGGQEPPPKFYQPPAEDK